MQQDWLRGTYPGSWPACSAVGICFPWLKQCKGLVEVKLLMEKECSSLLWPRFIGISRVSHTIVLFDVLEA